MSDTPFGTPLLPHEQPVTELRSLRRLITSPTQQAIDELRRIIHTPGELARLLVPVIADVLQKKIAANEKEITAALAPIIDKALHERTLQDKAAIATALAPTVAKALRDQHEHLPDEVAQDLAPLMSAAIREQVRMRRSAMVDALYPIVGSTIAKYVGETYRKRIESLNDKLEQKLPVGNFIQTLRRKSAALPVLVLVVLLLGIPLGWYFYRNIQNEKTAQQISAAITSSLHLFNSPVNVHVEGNEVELRGIVPNELVKQRVVEATTTILPSGKIQSLVSIAEPPPHDAIVASEVQRVTAAFNTVAGVQITSSYRNAAISLTGMVNDTSLQRHIVSTFERLPGITSLVCSFNHTGLVVQQVIYFIGGGSEIPDDEQSKLDAVRNILEAYPSVHIRIIGYSDTNGSKARNTALTLGRAVAVKNALTELGIAADRLAIEGNGESVPNLNPQVPENRCVRFEILELHERATK